MCTSTHTKLKRCFSVILHKPTYVDLVLQSFSGLVLSPILIFHFTLVWPQPFTYMNQHIMVKCLRVDKSSSTGDDTNRNAKASPKQPDLNWKRRYVCDAWKDSHNSKSVCCFFLKFNISPLGRYIKSSCSSNYYFVRPLFF